jgi:hypothetical protein
MEGVAAKEGRELAFVDARSWLWAGSGDCRMDEMIPQQSTAL